MPFSLPLPDSLRHQGWKVKIREKERVEEPHATVIRGKQVWRFGLRSLGFLDADPDPRHVPQEVVDAILGAMDASGGVGRGVPGEPRPIGARRGGVAP